MLICLISDFLSFIFLVLIIGVISPLKFYRFIDMKKVTGIGGVFFKSENPKVINEWYTQNLGIATSEFGAVFDWLQADDPSKKGTTVWCAFAQDTQYFNPSTKPFMINYRVEDLTALVAELKQNGVTVVDEIAVYDYGKFVHILDPDGNIIELWEPVTEKDPDTKAE